MMLSKLKTLLFVVLVVGCSHKATNRLPSSTEVLEGPQGCSELILPLVDEVVSLRPEDWQVDDLVQKNLITYEDWQTVRSSEDWQGFVSRELQTDQEREMGYVILALLKKRFKLVSDSRIKDRYRVLLAWCGG